MYLFTSDLFCLNLRYANDKILKTYLVIHHGRCLWPTNFLVSLIFQMTSITIALDHTRVFCWIIWTDVPVVPDSFHPCFHRSRRAHSKQCIPILPFAHNHKSLPTIIADHNSLRFARKVVVLCIVIFSRLDLLPRSLQAHLQRQLWHKIENSQAF